MSRKLTYPASRIKTFIPLLAIGMWLGWGLFVPSVLAVISENPVTTITIVGEKGKTPPKEPPTSESPVTRVAGKIVKLTEDIVEIEDPEGKIHAVAIPENLRKNIASAKVGDLAGVQIQGQTVTSITAPLPPGESWITEVTEDTILLSPEPEFKGFGLRVRITKDTVIEKGLKLQPGIKVHIEFKGDAAARISPVSP